MVIKHTQYHNIHFLLLVFIFPASPSVSQPRNAVSVFSYLSLLSSHLPSGWACTWGSRGRRAAAGALSGQEYRSNPAWGSNLDNTEGTETYLLPMGQRKNKAKMSCQGCASTSNQWRMSIIYLCCCPVCFWCPGLVHWGCQWWWRAVVWCRGLPSDFWERVLPDTWAPRWTRDLQTGNSNLRYIKITFIKLHYLNSWAYLTCTDAHYKPSHNDDLVGLGDLADPHHHGRDDGEDVVEEEGSLPAL